MDKEQWEPRETFLLRTNAWQNLKYLTLEQRGIVITKAFDFVRTGASQDDGDQVVDMTFDLIRQQIVENWLRYDLTLEEKKKSGRIGGIVASMKEGREISSESINFMKEEGCWNYDYLSGRGVPGEYLKKYGIKKNEGT